MSPEGVSHSMLQYVEMLEHQIETAKAFFLGSTTKGIQELLKLPEDVRSRIDQWIWRAAEGASLDPNNKQAQELIAAAILRSLEERMGMDDPT